VQREKGADTLRRRTGAYHHHYHHHLFVLNNTTLHMTAMQIMNRTSKAQRGLILALNA